MIIDIDIILARKKISEIEGKLDSKCDEERIAYILLSWKYNKRIFVISKLFLFVICVKRPKYSP